MKLTIRLERPEDYREVEALTREAFWGVFHPTCDEHYLVHKPRATAGSWGISCTPRPG